MVEVIIFYAYLLLECALALIIFARMYCEHRQRVEEERVRAEEAAAEMEAAVGKEKRVGEKGQPFEEEERERRVKTNT